MTFSLTKVAKLLATGVVLSVAASGAYAIDEAPDGGVGAVADFNITNGMFGLGSPPNISFSTLPWDFVDAGGATGGTANAFTFFNNPVAIFTNTPLASDDAPYGGAPVTGGNFPSGVTTASTITMDLSSWTNYWNGTNFNTGTNSAIGTYDSSTGAFDISWSTIVSGGPFDGQQANWQINGVAGVAPIPEASTYGMMLAGLGLVGFAVRRRKLVA